MILFKNKVDSLLVKEFSNENASVEIKDNKILINTKYENLFGLGEKFDEVDHKNKEVTNAVIEKFCEQGEFTYFPLPFFFTNNGLGFFIDTYYPIKISFNETISIEIQDGLLEDNLYIFSGTPKEIIADFIDITGKSPVINNSYFGPWVSAHYWHTEKMAKEQLDKLQEYKIPATNIVFEQWSDEATFYIFNGASYDGVDKIKNYDEYNFENSNYWDNPKELFELIHKHGLNILLWQCPIIKKLEEHEPENNQNAFDWEYAIKNDLIIKETDGTPYTIPPGNWFPGSLIPDFSKEETRNWWFAQRQYLIDIGVDGFKTDGGEFIYKDNLIDSKGFNGRQLKNKYCADYTESYHNFVNDDGIIFSRAGYIGQQTRPIQWAGDQQSTFKEFKSVLKAGLNATLSGMNYWSFDIGGFAGMLPSKELYINATQMATFVPIMQIHSEPMGGQFKELLATNLVNNERTPWNIANYYNDNSIIEICQKYYQLRMNILPYIISENFACIKENSTLMRHLLVDYPEDKNVYGITDEYMFGKLLVAPNVYEGENSREVYLPKGKWVNIFTNEKYKGESKYTVSTNDIPVFINQGEALVSKRKLFDLEYNNSVEFEKLHFTLYGEVGEFVYNDMKNSYKLTWNNGEVTSNLEELEFTYEIIL